VFIPAALIDRSSGDPCARVAREDAWDAALRGLLPAHRRVIVLRFRQGLNFREIGAALGLSDSGANRICLEAIAHLRDTGKYLALADN
jgi:DNA-directed RNA polymerase specialized sigma subunit